MTEGVEVSHRAASGYPDVPNLATDDAKKMWEKVVSEVPKIIHLSSVSYGMLVELENLDASMPEVPGFTPSGYVVPVEKVARKWQLEEGKELIEVY